MDFQIRSPEPTDADALADLHITTWREAYSHLLPEGFFSAEYIGSRHRMWGQVLQDPHGETVVRIAEAGGRPIGFAWAGPGLRAGTEEAPPRPQQLYAIYLLVAHHGSGVAQALLDEVLGNGPAMLWVAKENPRAIAFYTRNGFRFDGVEQIDPAAPSITDARMVR